MNGLISNGTATKTAFPWQERPHDHKDVMWRYKNNPIITRDNVESANSIFNSAVVK